MADIDSFSIDKSVENKLKIVNEAYKMHEYYANCKAIYFLVLKNEINALKRKFPNVDFYVEARFKSQKSTLNKMLKQAKKKDASVFDIFGVRYVIRSVDGSVDPAVLDSTCHDFMDFLMSDIPCTREIPGRRKDYIKTPKPTGYRGIHATRIHSIMKPFYSEVQVKAEYMKQIELEHSAYKPVAVSKYEDDIPDFFEFQYYPNGFCKNVYSIPVEEAFEKYFNVPYADGNNVRY